MSPRRTHDWQADFAVFSEDGRLTVIAEAKKKKGIELSWAAAWHRNYLAHQRSPAPPFVLLATPERLYVWKSFADDAPHPPPVNHAPTAVADARRIFSSYLHQSKLDPSEIAGHTFELIVGAWLNDLSNGLWEPKAPEEIRALIETGLTDAIENGRVVADVAA